MKAYSVSLYCFFTSLTASSPACWALAPRFFASSPLIRRHSVARSKNAGKIPFQQSQPTAAMNPITAKSRKERTGGF